MSNAVALTNTKEPPQFTPEQMQLIRDTVAKGATGAELQLFVYRARSMGLDPLKPGQVHFVKYGNNPGSIIVGLEGFRSIAHRTGKLSGIKRGPLKDDKGVLVGAWAEVYRTDWENPAREEVPLEEYRGTSPIWRQKPETMIKKVAECAALRMAFPNDLGGVYIEEEEESMNDGGISASAMQPGPDDGVVAEVTDETYRIEFGEYVGRSVDEVCRKIGKDGLIAEIEKREAQLAGKSKTKLDLGNPDTRIAVQEFIDYASRYIIALEKGVAGEPEEPSAFEKADTGPIFSQVPKMTREELGLAIFKEQKRLGINNVAIEKLTKEQFKKSPGALSEAEMESLLEDLSRRSK